MQKKLYFLNEEEKNRILNLHESRTKKQYLISEESTLDFAKKFKIPKGGLSTDELKTFNNIKPQWDMARPIGKACKTLGILEDRIVDTDEQIKQLVGKILEVYEKSGHSLYMNTDVAYSMGNIMNEFKSIPDLCYGIQISSLVILADNDLKQFIGYSGNDNFLKLFWDVYHESSGAGFTSSDVGTIRQAVFNTLKKIIKKSEDISKGVVTQALLGDTEKLDDTKKSTENVAEWPKEFSCILTKKGIKDSDRTFNNDKWKQVSYTNGMIEFYSSSGLFYKKYKDGGVLPAGDDNYWTYYCENNKPFIKETIKTIKDKPSTPDSGVGQDTSTPPVASGIGTPTRSVSSQIPTLLQQAGVGGTSLTQDAINKLYDKLSKKA
jgi:hypothetical protein